jgi:NitT/TauT family transport system substrate-binding protein
MDSRFIRSTVLFLLSFTLIAACQAPIATPPPASLSPLKISYNTWVGFFPLAIAQEKGFFAQQGAQVQLVYNETSSNISAFNTNQLDGVFCALGDAVTIGSQNAEDAVVAMTDESNGADMLVVQPGIQSIADLKGKHIGVKLSQFGELFVEQGLASQGLLAKDVSFVDTEASNVPKALQKQTIQAGHTWEPFISEAKIKPEQILFTSKQTPGVISDVIMFRGKVLRDRPEQIRAFLRAWFQAVDYWQANPQAGNALIAKFFKIDPKVISLEGIHLATLADNRAQFAPNSKHSIAQSAKLYNDFFLRINSVSAPVNIDKLLNSSFLPTTQP